MNGILKLLNVFLLSTVKFVVSPAYSFFLGLDYMETILATSIGGIIGFIFFFLVAKFLIYELHILTNFVSRHLPEQIIHLMRNITPTRKPKRKKKIFTRKNRLIARIMNQYGMWGLIVLTPILLGIPIGAVLSYKYYGRQKNLVPLMMVAIITWAIILSSFISLIPEAA